MKRHLCISACMLLSIMATAQRTLDLHTLAVTDSVMETIPTRDVVSLDDGVLVTYRFSRAFLQTDPLFDGASAIKINGFGLSQNPGDPSIPMRWDSFVIPDGCKAQVELVSSSFSDFPMELSPARFPLMYSDTIGHTRDNVQPIRFYTGLFPQELIVDTRNYDYRGHQMLDVCIAPLQYNMQQAVVHACTELSYKISYVGTGKREALAKTVAETDDSEDAFLGNTTLNWNLFKAGKSSKEMITRSASNRWAPGLGDYLILTVPEYLPAANRLADWKRMMGFPTYVVADTAWTPTKILESVSYQYNLHSSLKYLLIIGTHNDLPGKANAAQFYQYGTLTTYSYVSDYYYGANNSSYDLPIHMRGRLPVASLEEANAVVDKIINYERNPLQDSSFYSTAIHSSYFHDEYPPNIGDNIDGVESLRMLQNSEEIRSYVMQQGKNVTRVYRATAQSTPYAWGYNYSTGGLIPEDLRDSTFNWHEEILHGDQHIVNPIKAGAFYVLYDGHGSESSWAMPTFSQYRVSMLNNSTKLPIVFSMACKTGKFNRDSYPCFAETFINNMNGGCVAIFAPSEDCEVSNTTALTYGMFDAIWPNPGLLPVFSSTQNNNVTNTPVPTYRLGQILDQGLKRMFETTPEATVRWYTMRTFHLFGDPSMMIPTELPTPFTNVHVNRDYATINADAVEKAVFSFYNTRTMEVVSSYGYTAECPADPDIVVCISGHNKIPYIDDNGIMFLQNQNITGSNTFTAKTIKVGSHVTSQKAYGDVNFDNGTIILNGNRVELHPGTKVDLDTEFFINTPINVP